jgi:hypothetical protein
MSGKRWAVFVGVGLAMELDAIISNGARPTLSCWTRRTLGIKPHRRLGNVGAGAFVLLCVWLAIHIVWDTLELDLAEPLGRLVNGGWSITGR